MNLNRIIIRLNVFHAEKTMTIETSEHPADIVQRKLRSLPDTVGWEVLHFLDYIEQRYRSPQPIVKQTGLKQLLNSDTFKKRKSYDSSYIESHIQEERSAWD
ncbi:MAG: hypothetical protein D4R63_12270 [Methylococcaceae bacterium]|nr:MAG: hypothetical protein D4R63_12270 [Methylococcaceae bacterium]